jgi:hypothetical protein
LLELGVELLFVESFRAQGERISACRQLLNWNFAFDISRDRLEY